MTELALTAAVGERIVEEDEPEQLGLFGEPETEKGAALAVNRGRGPGRPPGARNKRTERSVGYLLARHRDPRAVLLEIAESNVHDLAALLGCDMLQALQEKRLAATAVLPYVAARITPEVLQDNRQVVHLTINEGRADPALAGGIGATATVLQNVEYQQVSEDGPDEL